MKTVFKSAVVAAAMATTLAVSLPVAAQKWDMPTRSNERNYMTRNIMEFAADVKKANRSSANWRIPDVYALQRVAGVWC